MTIEKYLSPTQDELFEIISEKYSCKFLKGGFILVEGDAPVMLIAHLDTVHKEPVKVICKSTDGNVLMSPQGIGGDDRCGVYAITKLYETAKIKPYLLFTCDEEIGGVGARKFVDAYTAGNLPADLRELKMLIEIDRRGSNDAVYYDCRNADLEKYISSKGFWTAWGTFSDISIIAPELNVAAVNLSSGYYNAHTLHEYINVKQLKNVIGRVATMIDDATHDDFPKFDYYAYQDDFDDEFEEFDELPADLPKKYSDIYQYLLSYYSSDEIESFREFYGDSILVTLFENLTATETAWSATEK